MKILNIGRTFTLLLCFSSIQAFANEEGEGWDELIYIAGGVWNDTGNYAAIFGDLPPVFWENRLSNGPIVADYFAENLGFELTPSHHVNGPVQGNNFSIIDSWAGQNGELDLSAMIDAYLESRQGVVSDKTLHVVWTGGHDVIEMVLEQGEIDYSKLDDAVKGIETAIYRIIDAGGKHIFSPTYADIGVSPAFTRAGLAERATAVATYYNREYRRMLTRVEYHTGQRIYRFDFDRYIANLRKNFRYFGFENGDEGCTEHMAAGTCDVEKFLFYTDAFVTSRAHKFVADAFAQELLQQVQSCDKGSWHPRANWWVCDDDEDDDFFWGRGRFFDRD